MSIINILTNTANKVKQNWNDTDKNSEIGKIEISISNLTTKLTSYFGDKIENPFVFGSYDRKTMIKNEFDSNSDVDIMVVFKNVTVKPQALMDRLKTFAESKYQKSEIYQSSPTIVLKLNHIKFEIAPAYISTFWGNLNIPAPSSSYEDWLVTDPIGFKKDLIEKHRNNKYLIKDLILILKYWNVKNGKIYSSFEIEEYIVNKTYYSNENIKDYFIDIVNDLPTSDLSIVNRNKVNKFIKDVNNVYNLEAKGNNNLILADIELTSLLS